METIKLWARQGAAVRQAIELGELIHRDTASEAWTDAFLWVALPRGLLSQGAAACPAPRQEPAIGLEVMLPAHKAARFAGCYSRRKGGYGLRSARVLGALGDRVEGIAPAQGWSLRGTSDAPLVSGDVVRKLLVKMETQADLRQPARVSPPEPRVSVKVRARASRRTVKPAGEDAAAEARAYQVAAPLGDWYKQHVGGSMVRYARLGQERRLQILETTRLAVPLATGTYACSGVVKNEDGTDARGYTLATVRTRLDNAGWLSQGALAALQMPDGAFGRPWLETTPVLRAGALLRADRGLLDGATVSDVQGRRQGAVLIPLKANMLATQEAMQLAEMAGQWAAHPSRAAPPSAFVRGVEHRWNACAVPLNACVIRFWNKQQHRIDPMVWVTSDLERSASWIVRHYAERPEIEQDYAPMKSGGWQLTKLSATR